MLSAGESGCKCARAKSGKSGERGDEEKGNERGRKTYVYRWKSQTGLDGDEANRRPINRIDILCGEV